MEDLFNVICGFTLLRKWASPGGKTQLLCESLLMDYTLVNSDRLI